MSTKQSAIARLEAGEQNITIKTLTMNNIAHDRSYWGLSYKKYLPYFFSITS